MSATELPARLGARRIPRFVVNLNRWAEARGVAVSVEVGPYDNDPGLRLWSNWSGSKERFLSLGLFPNHWHFPIARGWLTIPHRVGPWHSPLLAGEITVSGANILWEIDCGPSEFSITELGRIEIVTYPADETVFHGSAEDLVEAEICPRNRLPMRTRTVRAHRTPPYEDRGPSWSARRQLDGTYVYRLESQASLTRRLREYSDFVNEQRRMDGLAPLRASRPKPHLRLIIDNTKSELHP
jgi:hypothetical protein